MMFNSRPLCFALCALFFCRTQCVAKRTHAAAENENETNDRRALLKTVLGHPWYNGNKPTENTNDRDFVRTYKNLVRSNSGGETSRSYERPDYHKQPYYDYGGGNEFYKKGGGKGHFKEGKGKKSLKGKGYYKGKGGKVKTKGSKSSSSKYRKSFPPKPYPPYPPKPGPRRHRTSRIVPNFLISLVDPLVRRTIPTEADYAALAEATTIWFERAVQAELPDNVDLVQTRSLLERAESGAGIPLPRFNILVVFDFIEMVFSSFVEDVEDVPLAAEINAILLASINKRYLFQVVRQIPAFAGVNEVYAETIENTFEPIPTISPSPSPSPSESPPTSQNPSSSPSSAPGDHVPSSMPSEAPSPGGDLVGIQVQNFFTGYVVYQGAQPTDEEFAQLVNGTVAWFAEAVDAVLPEGVTLINIEPDVALQVFDSSADMGEPNVVIEYNYVDFLYRVSDGASPPNAKETLELMQDSLTEEYLNLIVRPIPVFAGAADAFLVPLGGSPTTSPSSATATPTPSQAASSQPSLGPTGGTESPAGDTSAPSGLPTGGTESPAGDTSAPSGLPTGGTESPAPTGASAGEVVLIENTFLAFASTQDPLTAPTDAQYGQVKDLTIKFWEPVLAALPDIGDRFLGTTAEIEFTQLNAGRPMEQFNILMDLASVSVRFEEGTENLPTPDELFVILRDSLDQAIASYIDSLVATVTDSAFAKVTDARYRRAMLDPPPEPVVDGARVRVENWYMAYVSAEDPLTEPSEEQYAQLVEQTVAYFEFVAPNYPAIGSSFVSADAAVDSTVLNAGVPADRFNILIQYEYIDLIFEDGTEDLPSPAEAFEFLRASLTPIYITDYVFTVTNSPFAFVNESVIMREV